MTHDFLFFLHDLSTYDMVQNPKELITWKMYDGANLWNSIPKEIRKSIHFLPIKSLLTCMYVNSLSTFSLDINVTILTLINMLLFYSKYMLFTGREGRTGKIFSVDLRFRAASEDEVFFVWWFMVTMKFKSNSSCEVHLRSVAFVTLVYKTWLANHRQPSKYVYSLKNVLTG